MWVAPNRVFLFVCAFRRLEALFASVQSGFERGATCFRSFYNDVTLESSHLPPSRTPVHPLSVGSCEVINDFTSTS